MHLRNLTTIMKSLKLNNKIAIVGGGPVGLFLAIRLANKGHSVDLFEKGDWPKDKTCGQGLMPSGLKLLEQIGIEFQHKTNCYYFNQINYFDGDLKVTGEMKNFAAGIERKVLSSLLLNKARECTSLTLHPHCKIDEIKQLSNGQVQLGHNNNSQIYEYVFACDGLHSSIRKKLGKTKTSPKTKRMGARVHFNQYPFSNSVEVYWAKEIECYMTPVNSQKLEIAFLWYEGAVDTGSNLLQSLLDKFPRVVRKLDMDKCCDDFSAYGSFTQSATSIRSGNIFFVGDAYCFEDGITGEGISLGLSSAEIIANNFTNFKLLSRIKVELLYMNYRVWIILALFMSRHPRCRLKVMKILQRFDWLFSLILKLSHGNFYPLL